MPDGGEDEGDVVEVVGTIPEAPELDHAAFADAIGFVDTARAAEASGSRFAYIMREAALLELALVNYAMRTIVDDGFVPVITPALVRERTMEEAGFFPTDRAQVYDVDDGELFLTGTSEVALSAIAPRRDAHARSVAGALRRVLDVLPREAGTYGKDTRGIFRVHQFDKVEMFSYCDPSESWAELDRILEIEQRIIGGLGIPYRVVNIAAGDLGPAAAKKYDIEGWLPSEGRYRELTSCSNYTRLLGAPARHADEGRARHRARAHAQRHRRRGQPHARVPVRALPGRRRRLRRARGAPRRTPASTASSRASPFEVDGAVSPAASNGVA